MVGIIVISNSAIIIGLWPAHFIWTFYCVLRYVSLFLNALYMFVYLSISNLVLCCVVICFVFWVCHFRTKRLGPVLKMVVVVALPVPLILWPIVGIVGSLLGGIGYGFFAPLIATFEAVGENVADKCYHCFVVSFSAFWFLLK